MKVYIYDTNTKGRILIKDYGDLSLKKENRVQLGYVPIDHIDHVDSRIVSAYPHLPKGMIDFSTREEEPDNKEKDYYFLSPVAKPHIFSMTDGEHMNVKENKALLSSFQAMIIPICSKIEAKFKEEWMNQLMGEMSIRWSTSNLQPFMWRSLYREKACDNYDASFVADSRLCFLYIVSKTIFKKRDTGSLYVDYDNALMSSILESVRSDVKYNLVHLCHFKFEMNYILKKGKIDNWEQTDVNVSNKPREEDFAKGEEAINQMMIFIKPIWNGDFFNEKIIKLPTVAKLIKEILENELLIKQLSEEKPKSKSRQYHFNLAIFLNVIGILKDTRNKTDQVKVIRDSVKAITIMKALKIPDESKNTLRFITTYFKEKNPSPYNIIFKSIGKDTVVSILEKYNLHYHER